MGVLRILSRSLNKPKRRSSISSTNSTTETSKSIVGKSSKRRHGKRSIKAQIAALTPVERSCFDNLKTKWEERYPETPFTDEMYLRFARCSSGKPFNEAAAWKAMKKFDQRYLTLTASSLEKQLISKTLFPVPGLKTSRGSDVFYMRPSRYFPKETSTRVIIDNLVYVMSCMNERETNATEGIGFVAYMNDWKMTNFNVDYCWQFMQALQGSVPTRVNMFLIVNPPSWFGSVWKMMKPMLMPSFRKKVHMIPEQKLSKYLMPGYEYYLPDETEAGQAVTDEIVQDFVDIRIYTEAKRAASAQVKQTKRWINECNLLAAE